MAADLVQTFAMELDDQTSGPAASAASALEELEARILGGQKRLREMQAAMGRLRGSTAGNTGAFKQLRDQITAQKASVANAQAQFITLGGTFGKTAAKQVDFVDRVKGALGPLGALGGGLMAVVGASLAAAAAIGVATLALIRFGIASADARRTEELRLAGLIATSRRGSRLASANADELTASIDRVSGVAAIGRADVSRYAESLARMGLRGANLSAALEGASISAAVGGDSAGRRFVALAAGAARTGRSVGGLLDNVRARLGPLNAALNNTLDRQLERFRENLGALFGGPRMRAGLDRLLFGLNQVGELFSRSSATGRAMRQLMETLFAPVLSGVGDAGPAVRRFFQRTIIGAQEVTIAFLRVRNGVRAIARTSLGADALLGSLTLAAPVIASVAGALFLLREGLSWVGRQLVVGVAFWTGFTVVVGRAVRMFSETDWSSLGRSVVEGIASGITTGADGLVAGAVRRVAGDASRAFRDALGIRSPSTVFAAYGVNVSRGLAEGMRAGAPEATSAVTELVAIPTATTAAPRAAPAVPGAAGAGVSITIGELVVRTDATTAAGISDDIRDQLARALEQLGLELGAVPT
jgi:hypothetical protein